MPLDNGLLHIHKCQKVTNVYCLLSQHTTRQLKFKTSVDGTLEPDTQSALADNNFYKTSDYLLQKRENPSKTHLWALKYNLKEIMERDYKSHMGSPCHSVFILPLFWCASTETEKRLFEMPKAIELKHQVSATFQFLNELWSNNSGEMSEFDSELYFRVAFVAFLIPLGSGEFSIICNLSIRVKISKTWNN